MIHRLLVGAAVLLTLTGCAPSVQPQAAPSPTAIEPSPSPSPDPSIYPVPSPKPRKSPTPPSATQTEPPKEPSPTEVTQAPGGIACGAVQRSTYRGTDVITRTTCFPVTGTTLSAIQASIRDNGPRVDDYRRAGATRWRVRWSYTGTSSGTSCAVDGASVDVAITFLLPDWKDAAAADETVRAGYESFAADVARHERVHRRIALQGGAAVRKAVRTFPAKGTCDQLSAGLRDHVKDVMDVYRAKQAAFDRREAG